MPTFETLGGTVSISDEQIVLSESIPRRVRTHARTDRRVQLALLAGVLVGVSILVYTPGLIWWFLKMIGITAGVYLTLVLYVRLSKPPQSRAISTDHVSRAYLQESAVYPPSIVLEYSLPDEAERRKPIVLQNRWQANRTEPSEILTALRNVGIPVDEA